MDHKVYPVCVIGGGSAGTMALLRTILNNDECLFFPGSPKNRKRSREMWVRKVENVPAHLSYKKGIVEPNAETINWINESAFKHNLYLQKNTGVVSVKKHGDVFEITDSKNIVHHALHIILCTGVMDVQPEIKGTIETVFDYANAQTIDYCLICDGHHVLNKKTSVIGHTNNAAWISIILFERYQSKNLTIVTNGRPTEFQPETQGILDLYGIKTVESPVAEIIGQDKGKVLEAFLMEDGSRIETDICFIAMGMIVYNEIAKELGADLDDRGFVITDEAGLTSIPGLYVAGDLKANTKKQIYTAWDTAVNSANAINLKIRVKKREHFKK